jgi:hypothetical protein
MDLQTLIMEHFRRQIDDEAPPYLISDEEALAYAIDAQDMFVRSTGGLTDMTVPAADVGTPATRLADLTVAVDNPWAALSPYVLRVRSARLVTDEADVEIIGEADLTTARVQDYGWTNGLSLDDTDTGPVRFGVLGLRENYVRWVRVPEEADTCRLHFYRLPFPRIEDAEDDLEIGEQHHIHLVKWMKYLAYSKQDAEIYSPNQAAKCQADFEAYCERARKETQRQRHKTRVVQFNPGY